MRRQAISGIMMQMAGGETERELLNREDVAEGGARIRIERVAGRVRWPGGWRIWERKLRRQARALVCEHRSTIVKVAQELAKRGELAGEEIDAVMGALGLRLSGD